jgi:hypothetical protein
MGGYLGYKEVIERIYRKLGKDRLTPMVHHDIVLRHSSCSFCSA